MAERERAVEVRIGVFVLGAIVVLALGILWVLGSLPAGRQANEYIVRMGTAAGVRKGDRVRISGIEVGRVEDISLRVGEELPVLFQITLEDSVSVTESARAIITSDGLLSSNYLQIDPGPPGAPALAPGSTIQGTEGAGLMEAMGGLEDLSSQTGELLTKLSGLVDDISTNIEPLVARMEVMLSDENMESFSGLLNSMHLLAEDMRPRTNALLEDLDVLVVQLNEGTEDLPELSAQLKSLLAALETSLGEDGARLAELLESAQGTMESAGATMEVTARNRRGLELALRDLQATLANLKSLTGTLGQQPSALVWKQKQRDRKPGEDQP